tara:strand:- start:489 stop:2225 length:1737 start_codon:yes stop_codon:yes gene_type:complete
MEADEVVLASAMAVGAPSGAEARVQAQADEALEAVAAAAEDAEAVHAQAQDDEAPEVPQAHSTLEAQFTSPHKKNLVFQNHHTKSSTCTILCTKFPKAKFLLAFTLAVGEPSGVAGRYLRGRLTMKAVVPEIQKEGKNTAKVSLRNYTRSGATSTGEQKTDHTHTTEVCTDFNLPPQGEKLRICIIGGAFNPFHIGHRDQAVELLKQEICHRVIYLPDGPRLDKPALAKGVEARLDMVAKAVEAEFAPDKSEFGGKVVVSDLQIHSSVRIEAPYATLRKQIVEDNPHLQFDLFQIWGADYISVSGMHMWKPLVESTNCALVVTANHVERSVTKAGEASVCTSTEENVKYGPLNYGQSMLAGANGLRGIFIPRIGYEIDASHYSMMEDNEIITSENKLQRVVFMGHENTVRDGVKVNVKYDFKTQFYYAKGVKLQEVSSTAVRALVKMATKSRGELSDTEKQYLFNIGLSEVLNNGSSEESAAEVCKQVFLKKQLLPNSISTDYIKQMEAEKRGIMQEVDNNSNNGTVSEKWKHATGKVIALNHALAQWQGASVEKKWRLVLREISKSNDFLEEEEIVD